ncbi:MAG: hypothetical protein Fur0022_00380 [Anaerolineales bacterium]
MSGIRKTAAYRFGVIIFLILLMLLMTEFAVSNVGVPAWAILAFGILQAILIVREYMHISRLFKGNPQPPDQEKER